MSTGELPHNLASEQSVLGSILMDRDRIVEVAHWLKPEMFYSHAHADIYAAMLHLFGQRTPPDTRTVSDELKRRGQLDRVGGVLGVSDLTEGVPTSGHIAYYARIVEEAATRRTLIMNSGKAAALAYDETQPLDDVRAGVLALMTEAITKRDDAGATPLGEMLNEQLEDFGKEHAPATSTGLYDLDEIIYGLTCEGRLITIAGRPGHGKTALALTIALNLVRQGKAGLFFSMEMSKAELSQRAIAMYSEVDGKIIQSRNLTDDQFRKATDAAGLMLDWPLYTRSGGFSLSDIRMMTLQHIMERGALAFVVVDYVGLVRASGKKGQTRQQEIGETTRGLKALAMETGTDVFMLAQLNRNIEGRPDGIPSLSDLREAGDIENDSNIVTFVINPEKLNPETTDKGKGMLWVVKHRGGPCGKVELRFNAPLTRFDNLSKFREAEGYGGSESAVERYAPPPAPPVRDMVTRIKGGRVIKGTELQQALADSADTTFSKFTGVPVEGEDDATEG
jgi:replicative DNA helicase